MFALKEDEVKLSSPLAALLKAWKAHQGIVGQPWVWVDPPNPRMLAFVKFSSIGEYEIGFSSFGDEILLATGEEFFPEDDIPGSDIEMAIFNAGF